MEVIEKKPKVSVCVVTYNQEKYIKDCLLSVLLQRFDVDLEILVGDDSSTDSTSEIIRCIAEQHPGLIKFFRHEVNLGASGNYQFLISRATGDFIAHLDGDDFWLPGKLELQLKFMEKHPECSAVYTNAAVVDAEKVLWGIFNNKLPELQDINYLLRHGNYLNHSSLLYREGLREAMLSIDGDFIDYRMHCRLALKGQLGYLNNALVVYRTAVETSMVLTVRDKVMERYWDALLESNKATVSREAWLGGVKNFWGRILYASIRSGKSTQARYWGKRIRKEIAPFSSQVLVFGVFVCLNFMYGAIVNRYLSKITKNPLRIANWR